MQRLEELILFNFKSHNESIDHINSNGSQKSSSLPTYTEEFEFNSLKFSALEVLSACQENILKKKSLGMV